MRDSDRYRENAAECERIARGTAIKSDKAEFEQMAEQWRALASRAESREIPEVAGDDD